MSSGDRMEGGGERQRAAASEDVVILRDGAMLDRTSVGVGAVPERPKVCSSRRRRISARIYGIGPPFRFWEGRWIDLGHRQTSLTFDACASDTRAGVREKAGTAQNKGKSCKGEAHGLLLLLLPLLLLIAIRHSFI